LKLLAPANPKELTNRLQWFKTPEALKLAKEKRVEFGIEIKGVLEEIKKTPPIFWGVHLPVEFATEWYYGKEKRQSLIDRAKRASALKPDYAIMHGIDFGWPSLPKDDVHRYLNRADPKEVFALLEANIELIKILKKYLPLKIENGCLVDLYFEKNRFLPHTSLHLGAQKLDDLLYFQQKTGVDIVFDLEHLTLTLNFLNRQKNYQNVPITKIKASTAKELEIAKIYGFKLKKGSYPYLEKKATIEDKIRQYQTKYYHVCGNTQEFQGNKILSHGPIELNDRTFRQNLQAILAQKPEWIVSESTNPDSGPEWNYLRPNENEISFRNLCRILLEEL